MIELDVFQLFLQKLILVKVIGITSKRLWTGDSYSVCCCARMGDCKLLEGKADIADTAGPPGRCRGA